jgi:hypothetical protein
MTICRCDDVSIATPTTIAAKVICLESGSFFIQSLLQKKRHNVANPFVAASKGFVDEVIQPHSTRKRIALGLRKLRNATPTTIAAKVICLESGSFFIQSLLQKKRHNGRLSTFAADRPDAGCRRGGGLSGFGREQESRLGQRR